MKYCTDPVTHLSSIVMIELFFFLSRSPKHQIPSVDSSRFFQWIFLHANTLIFNGYQIFSCFLIKISELDILLGRALNIKIMPFQKVFRFFKFSNTSNESLFLMRDLHGRYYRVNMSIICSIFNKSDSDICL